MYELFKIKKAQFFHKKYQLFLFIFLLTVVKNFQAQDLI